MAARDKYNSSTVNQQYVNAKKLLNTNVETINTSVSKIEQIMGYKIKNPDDFAKEYEFFDKILKRKEDSLKDILKEYNKLTKQNKDLSFWQVVKEYMLMKLGKNTNDAEQKVNDFIKNLSADEKKLLEGENITKENIEKALTNIQEKRRTLKEQTKNMSNAFKEINNTKKTMSKILKDAKKKYGKTAKFDEKGILIVFDSKTKKFVPVEKPPIFEVPKFTSRLMPEKISTEVPTNQNEINQAKKQLTEIQDKIRKAIAELPKGEAKTEEQLAKEFIEKNGTKKDVVEKIAKEYKDDLARLLERNKNWAKIGGWAAGGAAALALLGYAFAPKNNK